MKTKCTLVLSLVICNSIFASAPAASGPNAFSAQQKSKSLTCEICTDDKPIHEFTHLSCMHFACTDCFMGLINSSLDSKDPEQLRCATQGCRKHISHEDIQKIMDGYQISMRDKLAIIMTKKTLATMPEAKQCPTPDCPAIFLNEAHIAQTITCAACSKNYCSNCLKNHVHNISCEMAARTVQTSKETQESEQWKQQNTRPCPRCKVRIEKNNGCMHMTCTNPQCKYEFCWHCAAPRFEANGNVHPSFCVISEAQAAVSRQRLTGESQAIAEEQQLHNNAAPGAGPAMGRVLDAGQRLEQLNIEVAIQRSLRDQRQIFERAEQQRAQQAFEIHQREAAAHAARQPALNDRFAREREEELNRMHQRRDLFERARLNGLLRPLAIPEQFERDQISDQIRQTQWELERINLTMPQDQSHRQLEALRHREAIDDAVGLQPIIPALHQSHRELQNMIRMHQITRPPW